MQRMAKVALQRRLGKHAWEEKQRRLGPRFSLLEETTPPTTTTASHLAESVRIDSEAR